MSPLASPIALPAKHASVRESLARSSISSRQGSLRDSSMRVSMVSCATPTLCQGAEGPVVLERGLSSGWSGGAHRIEPVFETEAPMRDPSDPGAEDSEGFA